MKALFTAFALLCLTAPAFAADAPVKNAGFARQAKLAAKSIFDLNWGPSAEADYEISHESFEADDTHTSGTYEVVTTTEEESERHPRGIDFTITIVDQAVLKVEVACKVCG